MMTGDRIISLNGEKIYLYKEMQLFGYLNQGEEVLVEFERDGAVQEVKVKPRYSEETGSYLFGFYQNAYAEETGLGRLKYAWYEMRFCAINTYKSLQALVQGKLGREDVAGPVGIVSMMSNTIDKAKESAGGNAGLAVINIVINMLNFAILLSANLGVMNLLPFPALDGGRTLLLLVEGIFRKKLPVEKEAAINMVGFVKDTFHQ